MHVTPRTALQTEAGAAGTPPCSPCGPPIMTLYRNKMEQRHNLENVIMVVMKAGF